MSKDTIYREDAIKAVEELPNAYNGWSDAYDKAYIISTLEEVPKADRPQGKWIEMGQNENGTHNVKCNQCNNSYKIRGHAKSIYTRYNYKFCPYCGARMKGADDE